CFDVILVIYRVLVVVLLIAVLLVVVAQSLEEAEEDSPRVPRLIQKINMNNVGNQPNLLRSQREPEASPLLVVCLWNPHQLQLEALWLQQLALLLPYQNHPPTQQLIHHQH
ncbi:Uncharacterized protein APZ42_006101, partial [Daphnia magna]